MDTRTQRLCLARVLRALCLVVALATSALAMAQNEPALVRHYSAEDNTLTLTLDRLHLGLADRLRYTLIVEASNRYDTVFDTVGETLGPFLVVGREPYGPIPLGENRARWQRQYWLEASAVGTVSVPALGVSFVDAKGECLVAPDCIITAHGRAAGGRAAGSRQNASRRLTPPTRLRLQTEPIEIHVDTILPEDVDLTRPRDIAPPRAIAPMSDAPRDRVVTWPVLAGMGTVLLLAGVGLFYYRRSTHPPAFDAPIDADARSRALTALESLRRHASDLSPEHAASLYRTLSTIVRDYLFAERLAGASQTTSELLSDAPIATLPGAHHALLQELLMTADLIKFARFVPSTEHSVSMLDRADAFIRETSEAPRP